jgi:hypothetical protein
MLCVAFALVRGTAGGSYATWFDLSPQHREFLVGYCLLALQLSQIPSSFLGVISARDTKFHSIRPAFNAK